MMSRILLLAAVVAAIPSVASGQDTTRTLFAMLPFRGAHIAFGPGTMPYLDDASPRGASAQVKLMVTLKRFPDWSFGVSSTAIAEGDTTAYVAAGTSPAIHPHLNSHAGAIEVQRRWTQSKLIHPIVGASVGSIRNNYFYHEFANGRATHHEEQIETTGFVQIAGGLEMNLTRWMRGNGMLGYRSGGRMTIPEANGDNGGVTFFLNLALGKF
jgi:hypothetical protein